MNEISLRRFRIGITHIKREELRPNKKQWTSNLLCLNLNLEKGTMKTLRSLELKNQVDRGITETITLYHLAMEIEEDHIFYHTL